ncbi:MAG: acyltransferase family protein [Lachnospiraceae bacterium]
MDNRSLSEKEFSNKIKLISFVMACMVVSWHNYTNLTYNLDDGMMSEFVKLFVQVIHNIEQIAAVPFFFLISGFLFFRNYTLKDTGKKWKSRIRSIVVPWILWGSLNWIGFLILDLLTGYQVESVDFSLDSYCSVVFANKGTIYWYLQTSIFFFLLAPLLYLLLRNYGKPTGTIVLCIVMGICTSSIMPDGNIVDGSLGGFLPSRIYNIGYFMLGSYIAINHQKLVFIRSKELTIFGVIGSVICSVLVQFFPAKGILLSVFCICVWFAFDCVDFNKEFPWFVEMSFFIYMLHSPVINIIRRVFLYVGGQASPVCAFASFILSPLLTLIVVLFMAYVLKKYFNRVWKLLNGGRAS